ncbi:PAAR domain-containing protein [Aeromonas caviae]|uniref:PAAR domain-containing protein n=1 Tax=Aeromonas caviae TaxID=648 RepID=UPI00311C8D9C
MRNVARKGDPTSTGGEIQDGDSSWISEGSPTTYIGMMANCPACKVGQGPIVAVGPPLHHRPGRAGSAAG